MTSEADDDDVDTVAVVTSEDEELELTTDDRLGDVEAMLSEYMDMVMLEDEDSATEKENETVRKK